MEKNQRKYGSEKVSESSERRRNRETRPESRDRYNINRDSSDYRRTQSRRSSSSSRTSSTSRDSKARDGRSRNDEARKTYERQNKSRENRNKDGYSRRSTYSQSNSEFENFQRRESDDIYKYDSNPFFSNSSVKSQVDVRTNRADDFFENKNYKPWDKDDDFNRSTAMMNRTPQVKRKTPTKVSRINSLKSGVGRVSKRVFASSGSDEGEFSFENGELDGIAENLKNTRNNKRLLDELNNKKKPLTKGQRKFKNIMLSGSIILVVLVIGVTLSLTVLFKCENIEVQGVSRYSAEDIVKASDLKYGENIFLSNKSEARKKIEEKYPYIESAEIGFNIPSTLTIRVTEATPEYYIQDGTRFYIISKEGKILEEVIKRELDIPTIVGCKLKDAKVGEDVNAQNSKIITVLNEIANSMESNGVTGINEIDLTDMSNIELNYQDRITIVIGMPEDIDYKIRTAMTIIATKLSESDTGTLKCSNLVEGRTDGKENASYWQPNYLVPDENSTEQITEPVTEQFAESPTTVEENLYNNYETDTQPVDISTEVNYQDIINDTVNGDNTVANDNSNNLLTE